MARMVELICLEYNLGASKMKWNLILQDFLVPLLKKKGIVKMMFLSVPIRKGLSKKNLGDQLLGLGRWKDTVGRTAQVCAMLS